MTVSFDKLRKLIHRKTPEILAVLPAGNTIAGGFIVSDKNNIVPGHDSTFYVGGVSVIWRYNADEDAWMQVPNSGIVGTFGAGSCGEYRAISAPGGVQVLTATGGTTTTIVTNLTLASNLAGCRVRVVAGPGAGYVGNVLYNTVGANSTITFETPSGVAFTAATQFELFAGSLWFFNAGAGTVGFAVYDVATNAWTQRSVTGIATTWATDGQLVGVSSASSNAGAGFVNGTASAGAGTTLTDAAKTWPANGWTNFQVRIISGTGAGQIRTIASNTGTVLTVSAAWTTNPDATSVYVIEGNDDHIYLSGNNVVTLYRYTVSTNTWATLSPVAARAAAQGAGGTLDWVDNVPAWQETSLGVYGNHYLTTIIRQNGRYLYSFRGAGTNALDVYDIAANTWISTLAYGNQQETFTTGSCSIDAAGIIYVQKENLGRIYKFDVNRHRLDPCFLYPWPEAAVLAGDKMFIQTFSEGGTGRWLYTLAHTRAELSRVFLV